MNSNENDLIVWINARFLMRPVTGVERVAREVITAIIRDHLSLNGCFNFAGKTVRFQLIAPCSPVPLINPWSELPLIQTGFFQGHLWEQIDLPRCTAGHFLLNLCNTAPLFKRLQWTFLHDAQTFAIPLNFTPALRYWYRFMFRCVARTGLGVVTNSFFSASELSRFLGIDRSRFCVAYLGADHVDRIESVVTPRLQDLFSKLRSQPFVLAVSSDNPNKNFASVISALESMGSNVPACVIVGKKNDRVFAQSRLLSDRVYHLGYVSDGELIALYRHATVMVYPSFYEGFGLPPLEAMWHGCPVVVSSTSAMPEINGDAVLYCEPDKPLTLATALNLLINNDDYRCVMSNLGRIKAKSYTWRKTAAVIMNFLKSKIIH